MHNSSYDIEGKKISLNLRTQKGRKALIHNTLSINILSNTETQMIILIIWKNMKRLVICYVEKIHFGPDKINL